VNGITLMVACVNPSKYNIHETISTLRYAQRAKHIKTIPVKRTKENKDGTIQRLERELEMARNEIAMLKAALDKHGITGSFLGLNLQAQPQFQALSTPYFPQIPMGHHSVMHSGMGMGHQQMQMQPHGMGMGVYGTRGSISSGPSMNTLSKQKDGNGRSMLPSERSLNKSPAKEKKRWF
jgi:hypothetical protein